MSATHPRTRLHTWRHAHNCRSWIQTGGAPTVLSFAPVCTHGAMHTIVGAGLGQEGHTHNVFCLLRPPGNPTHANTLTLIFCTHISSGPRLPPPLPGPVSHRLHSTTHSAPTRPSPLPRTLLQLRLWALRYQSFHTATPSPCIRIPTCAGCAPSFFTITTRSSPSAVCKAWSLTLGAPRSLVTSIP